MTSATRAAAALTAVLALSLTACSGSGTTSTDPPTAAANQGGGRAAGPGGGQGGGQPGVSGKIAAIDGKTLQVQNSESQTAVTYTDKTTFTEVKAVTAVALKTGLCATVRIGDAAASASATDQVTAGTVALTSAVHGTCEGGFGGVRPSGAPSGAPSGMPSDRPSPAPSGAPGARRGMGAAGRVMSIDGATFVVANTRETSGETANITVTTTAQTSWTQVARTTAKSVAVGTCAFATGKADPSGAVTATALRLSKAANGTCTTGFGAGRNDRSQDQQPSGAPTNG